ncbi:TetR/AcrR family transcriptional regulator [Bosea caraganae]|uniref:TetR/AcrR family transcriptional regulator n=1 Tax=Bosea caraganae TaxID=2763117 RepID=A0A370KZC9_9HYPH|nr:TetR/AcrR family transcriptional regulator [Bosea caraganae]RDJ20353.1 TetR/AcrR family transcriptional regulator [Bosea caraganae]RDJ26566.1 TetR/AcrR family transcriptional regulator [Bosea caraganae]
MLTDAKSSRTKPAGEGGEAAPRRRRMVPADREQMIVAAARRYFADYGLTGSTTELAKRMGITQPLLYRYFPTKDALIARVFESLFPQDKSPEWERLLEDASIPMRERLKTFYKEFSHHVFTYEHVRLFLFSGLSKFEYNTRYYELLTKRLFHRIALGLRQHVAAGGSAGRAGPVSDAELELVQSLHAAIYHVGFRRWVHTPGLSGDIDGLIEFKVDCFLDGVAATMQHLPPE